MEVLDATCGSRMMWFDKQDDRTLYFDKRNEVHPIAPNRGWPKGTSIKIKPSVVGDFSFMPFIDDCFNLVFFDPPHIQDMGQGLRKNGIIAKRYGLLFAGWEQVLSEGFKECFRVLRPNGVLLFKWCEIEIPLKKVLSLTNVKPLIAQAQGKKMGTHWIVFMKPNKPFHWGGLMTDYKKLAQQALTEPNPKKALELYEKAQEAVKEEEKISCE